MKTCYLCGHSQFNKRPGSVRDNPNIDVLECKSCGLVFLSSFGHIKPSHYANSGMHKNTPISSEDWLKECHSDDERRFNFFRDRLTGKSLLDFGCGAGGFLLKSRDVVASCTGVEPELKLQNHFSHHGLAVHDTLESLLNGIDRYDIITAFHVIEHIPDPVATLRSLVELLESQGELIVEVPNSEDALLTLYNCEGFRRFTYWSQHLYLFNQNTLTKLVRKAGLSLRWMKQIQRYPLSNHLYWLTNGKPGGHKQWLFLNDPTLVESYANSLASLGKCDTILAGLGPK